MTAETALSRDRIRAFNDAFRRSLVGGTVVVTAGFDSLPSDSRRLILARIRAFDNFNEDNDPHGEHDFGLIEDGDVRCIWKIDLYEATKVKRYFIARPLSSSLPGGDVDLGAFARGHALQRIDLYPVRAKALSSHNRYSRLPKARKRKWRTKLLLGRERPSNFPVANRLAAGAASSMSAYQPLSVAPSGTMPSSTKRQSAIASFRANATMPTLRPRMPLEPKRSRHHSESLLSG
jgi:hypothetical protein